MSEKGKSHKAYPPEFKSKCVRELLDGGETLSQVASRNGIAPSVLSKWKSQVLENMDAVFGAEAERRTADTTYVRYIVSLVLFGTNGIIASAVELTAAQITLIRTLLGCLVMRRDLSRRFSSLKLLTIKMIYYFEELPVCIS